jgi:ABC-three component (ABC-3C) system Middle Component 2
MVRIMNAQTLGSRPSRLFNTPLECGFRLVIILDAISGEPDLQRLVSYDYLLVHSGDEEDGPASLHPAVPFRGTELLVKRELVRQSLDYMFSRELLEKRMSSSGITYCGTALTHAFARLLKSGYANELKMRAEWLSRRFGDMSDSQLTDFMSANVGRWGAEFERLTSLRTLEL